MEYLGHGQTLFRVTEDGFDLAAGHSWEPFEEIVDARAVFEVREQGLHGHSCSAKNPRSTDSFRVSLDDRTSAPIKHAKG
jgi:hypothetical protein